MEDEETNWSRNGTISAREFYASALALAERWKRTNPSLPPWTWLSFDRFPFRSTDKINGFLTLEKLCLHELSLKDSYSSKESLQDVTQAGKEEEVEQIDNATLVDSDCGLEILYYDFHIVYSSSYRVPIMYFRAYRTDGQSLSLAEIEKELPSSSSKILVESKWTFITQEEHPYLKRPWYKLHPCGTSEWLNLLLQSESSLLANKIQEVYLISWLSVVGQVFGLRIPSQMINLNE